MKNKNTLEFSHLFQKGDNFNLYCYKPNKFATARNLSRNIQQRICSKNYFFNHVKDDKVRDTKMMMNTLMLNLSTSIY